MSVSAPPEHLGNYVIDSELGRGAFGVVYRAHHVDRPDAPVALKVVEGRGNLDRSMLEPAILSQLDHPCIVGIQDYFRDRGRLVLALEFVEGEDLKTLLDRGETFSQSQVHDLLVQIAGALAAAHARQIVHRDIKPSNILVVRDGGRLRFVLTDFGIGQQVEGIQDRKHTGGTYLFMAPEQLRGRPGPQSDLWALGVVAYRLVTGRLPFPGPSLPDLARQITYADAAPLSQVCAEPVDPELEKIISRLLEKSLQERIGSADELLRLLGFRGRPDEVLSGVSQVRRTTRVADTLDRQLTRSIRWRKIVLGLLILGFYLLPSGIITTGMLIAGLWLFFKAQTDDAWSRRQRVVVLAGALVFLTVCMLGRTLLGINEPSLLYAFVMPHLQGVSGGILEALVALTAFFSLIGFFAPILAASVYVGLRRRQREKVLRDATLQSGTGSDEYLNLLRRSLDYRFADVGFHLKYAEALVARGRHADAAVEARLILEQDPYNFNGQLLLANVYYTLGLRDDCAKVCDDYLAVSGFCFEFAELRDQCRAGGGAA